MRTILLFIKIYLTTFRTFTKIVLINRVHNEIIPRVLSFRYVRTYVKGVRLYVYRVYVFIKFMRL